MNRNRLIIIIILIALLAVGVFTIRAVLNTRALLSPAPEAVQEEVQEDEVQEEQAIEAAVEVPSPTAEVKESGDDIQPVGTSALDLMRIVELTVVPHDLDVDEQGNLYVVGADVSNPQILKFDRDGNLLASWGGQGSGEGQFAFAAPPGGPPLEGGFVTVDEQGNVYVSDPYNNRVQKFDQEGNFLEMWGSIGESGAPFNVPGPLSIGQDGSIYVADFDGVHQFSQDDSYAGMLETAGEVAYDSQGNRFSTVAFQNMVAKLDENGQVAASWGGEGDEQDGYFNFPLMVEIDSNDAVYVSDLSGRVQIFDTQGNFLGRFNLTTYQHLQLKTNAIIAMDAVDHLYVGAEDRNIVYVLRSLDESQRTDLYPEGSIAAALEADGRFSTFLEYFAELRGADLRPWPFLQNPEYSAALFVPTDEAFAALPSETLDRLANDETYALDLLTLHTIDKKLYAQDFGLLKSWPTGLANQQVVIEIEGDEIRFEGAKVIETDIEAGNFSTIHVIDSVTGLERLAGN